ncbi:MAG: ECF transporter S component [Abitibacteriaceae bacterium]|nr:ECF transporter S component [Abditibacteriaceae bacterium]
MRLFLVLVLMAVTTALTMVVRIPIPATGGYLNFGDMSVVFCGLMLGGRWGSVAGGVGSAAADVLGGFVAFAPITLIAKGLEAAIVGTLGKKHLLWVFPAVLAMVAVYFFAEIFMPGMGLAPALAEIPANVIQAIVGGIGGISLYKAVISALPEVNRNVDPNISKKPTD